MSCQYDSNYTIAPGVTYEQFTASFADGITCNATYLRPDPGGALIPWLYALFLLLLHLPACIIRAVRWESAQYLALGLAVMGIALCVQAYLSTRLKSDEVLVWMPLTLVLDVGAMLQMVVLIIEKHEFRPLRTALKESSMRAWQAIAAGLYHKPRTQAPQPAVPLLRMLDMHYISHAELMCRCSIECARRRSIERT